MSGHAHASSTRQLKVALAATAVVAVVEVLGGVKSGSLALLSDAAHVSMDVVALGIALAAAVQAKRPATHRQTYGFARYEILAALANGGLLTAVTVLIVIEAFHRIVAPVTPAGPLMAAVAAFGLIVNVGIGVMLVRSSHGNLNMRAAIWHVSGDALGAIAVIIGGILISLTGVARIDPILSLVVAAIIVAGVLGIVREATDVLLESAPDHAEVPAVGTRIRKVTGVVGVHDLHVWTIGSGTHALSAHVVLDDRKLSEASAILRIIVDALRDDFDITHATVQFECDSCESDTTIICSPSSGSFDPAARESERSFAKSAGL